MINWHDKTGVIDADCPWDEDVVFAELVAKKLEIPFHVVDLSEPYRASGNRLHVFRIPERPDSQS